MKQIVQSLSDGRISLVDVPRPAVPAMSICLRVRSSLISSGTERLLLDFGKANWLEKARQQPDKVRMVADKVKADGLLPTIESIRAKLRSPIAAGYSNAGVVVECGSGVIAFKPGDRVISNGPHAEVVTVPANLCAKIPDGVSDDEAAFGVVGSIALHAIRLIEPQLGECVVLTGLGLIGLMAVQMLRAAGCRVLGVDFDGEKLRLAERFGAEVVNLSAGEDPVRRAERFSNGRGVDAVIIAAATKSHEPVHQAALMSRRRGRIVLAGVTGLHLARDDFYKKELSFQVSCSYGPGRYDPRYEAGGQDYPLHYVRWTAQRNFETVLDMLATRQLDVRPLITHEFAFDQAGDAYALLQSGEPHIAVLLKYPDGGAEHCSQLLDRCIALSGPPAPKPAPVRIGCIGAGNYATKTLLPAFRAAGAGLEVLVSNTGLTAAHAGRSFGFRHASSDPDRVFADREIDTVVIATRHDSHARYVCKALSAGQNVFVEKPLAITDEELDAIERAYGDAVRGGSAPRLMVGFNRRFAPQVVKMRALLSNVREPKSIIVRVNAGQIPADHWTRDAAIGGGRIVGEACHFIDLIQFLIGTAAVRVEAIRPGGGSGGPGDSVSAMLDFEDGSIGSLHYITSGHKSLSKERVEVFCAGRVLILDNFRRLTAFGWPGFSGMRMWRQNKGAAEMVAAFVSAIRSGAPSPIPFEGIMQVSRITLRIAGN